jgi:hypothetical protein
MGSPVIAPLIGTNYAHLSLGSNFGDG